MQTETDYPDKAYSSQKVKQLSAVRSLILSKSDQIKSDNDLRKAMVINTQGR